MKLANEQVAQWHQQGYLVIPRVFSPKHVERLKSRVDDLAAGRVPAPEGVTAMEEPVVARGETTVVEQRQRFRKLEGVRLATDDVIETAAHHEGLVAIMCRILGPDIKLLRAAAMLKPPQIGSPKGLHQDAAYYPVEPQEHVAAWLALDQATPENGCMEVLPFSHRGGLRKHERREYETDVVFEGSTGHESGLVQLPMDPGDVLLAHCLTPHRSGANRTPDWRRALILAYMSSKSKYTVAESERPPWVDSLPIAGQSYPGCV